MYCRPQLGEYADMLIVEQIKELMVRGDELTSARICMLIHDLVVFCQEYKINASASLLRLIIALSQINLYIWYMKEELQAVSNENLLALSHQINGIRNQLKNALDCFSGNHHFQGKSNVGTDQLEGWDFSILKNEVDEVNHTQAHDEVSDQYQFHYPCGELIDMMTILQIKEVKFQGDRRQSAVMQLASLSKELDIHISQKNECFIQTGLLLNGTILLALINLMIWENKDKMSGQIKKEDYNRLLDWSQELNGVRNSVRNELLDVFQENSLMMKRTTFLSFSDQSKWFIPVLQRLNHLKSEGANKMPL